MDSQEAAQKLTKDIRDAYQKSVNEIAQEMKGEPMGVGVFIVPIISLGAEIFHVVKSNMKDGMDGYLKLLTNAIRETVIVQEEPLAEIKQDEKS